MVEVGMLSLIEVLPQTHLKTTKIHGYVCRKLVKPELGRSVQLVS